MSGKIYRIRAVVLVGALFAAAPASSQDAADTLEQLLNEVRVQGQQVTRENRAREQAFQQNRNQRKAMLDATLAELRDEQAKTERLKARFDANEQELEALSETLRIRIGSGRDQGNDREFARYGPTERAR
jgi:septal ring factor EnvC (AmiA/AmiB activator)